MRKLKPLSVVLVSALSTFAFAEDPAPAKDVDNLQTVVVTGSRVARNPIDMAATIDVIDQSDISDGKARVDLTEDLNGITGLQGLNRHNYAQDLQISSRGFGARSTFGIRSMKLIQDGIPASMADGQGWASTFDLDQMQRIEVLQGPLAAIYGNESAAVIQAFTKEGKGDPTIETSAEKGSWNTSKEDYAISGSENGIAYLIDDSHFHTDGYRPDSAANREQQLAKLSFHPNEDGKVIIEANTYQQFAKDPLGLTQNLYLKNPFGPLTTTVSPAYNSLADAYDTRKSVLHNQYGMSFDQFLPDGSQIQSTLYLGNRHVSQFQSSTALSTSTSGVVDYSRLFYGEDIRWIKNWAFSNDSRLIMTAGIDNDQYQDNRHAYQNYLSSTSGTPANYTCGSGVICGVYGSLKRAELDTVKTTDPYIQVEFLEGKWDFTGGVRYTHLAYNVDNTLAPFGGSTGYTTEAQASAGSSGTLTFVHVTPVASVLYNLSPETKVYVSATNGLEAPTMNELFYTPATSSTVKEQFNFGLKASDTNYFEAGVKSFISPSTLLKFDAFSIYLDNESVVAVNANGVTAYKNAHTQRFGGEWSLDSQLSNSVTAKMALTLMKAYYADTQNSGTNNTIYGGNTLPGVAEKTFFTDINWETFKGLALGAEFLARGRIFVEDTNTQMPAPGYGITNLKAVWHQEIDHWKFKEFVRYDNVFDRTYVGSVIIGDANLRFYEPGAPRSYMVGFTGSYQF